MSSKKAPKHVQDWLDTCHDSPTITWIRNLSPAARQRLDERLQLAVRESMEHEGKSKVDISIEIVPNKEAGRVEMATDFKVSIPKVLGTIAPMQVAPGTSGRFHTFGETPAGMGGETVDNVTPLHKKN